MPAKLISTLTGHSDRVWTLAWNPNGTLLASSGGDKKIRLWAKEGDSWQCVVILDETHDKTIRRLCWSPCGNYIVSASFDSTVSVWKLNHVEKSWENVYNLEGHSSEVKSVALSHDGQLLATCGRDRSVWIWERATNDTTDELGENEEAPWDCADVKNDHSKDVKQVAWHPTANILVSCSYDDTVKFYHKEEDNWKCYQTLSSHTSTVWSADFSASGEFLATCSDDKTVRIWKNLAHDKLPAIDHNSWKCVSVIQGYHTRTIYDISWNKETDSIVSSSGDNSLVFYARSGEVSAGSSQDDLFVCVDKVCDAHKSDVNSVSWNPKYSNILASASDDRTIKIWHYENPDKGMIKPMTVVDEILTSLKKTGFKEVCQKGKGEDKLSSAQQTYQTKSIMISDFNTLLTLIQSLQNLQSEINPDTESKRSLEDLFQVKLSYHLNPQGLELCNLLIDEKDTLVNQFNINVIGSNGQIEGVFEIIFNKEKFKMNLPRRSYKFIVIASNLFVLDKTGDMFQILDSGSYKFLLGHLFSFSDVKFILKEDKSEIRHIISADRDEKIRVSDFPETYRIQRFCFGHKSFITRLYIVDDNTRFISIDQESNAMLWDLKDIGQGDNIKPIKPRLTKTLGPNSSKRIKV